MTKEVRFYVYVDRHSDDDEPFYVGKGRLNRVKDFKHRNQLWHNTVNVHGVKREIVFETLDEQEALDEECRLIFELKTRDYFGGANKDDGGQGPSGYRHAKSTREILSVMSKNRLQTVEERKKASEKFSRMWRENRDKIMVTHARGVTHRNARLTEADVLRVREAYRELDVSKRGSISDFYRKFSLELNVTSENLFRIVHRKTWTHLP